MTLSKMFKKIEAYNEIAELMGTEKAQIYLADTTSCCVSGEHFKSFKDLRKYVMREYITEIAYQIINSDEWEINGEITIKWNGSVYKFTAELTAM